MKKGAILIWIVPRWWNVRESNPFLLVEKGNRFLVTMIIVIHVMAHWPDNSIIYVMLLWPDNSNTWSWHLGLTYIIIIHGTSAWLYYYYYSWHPGLAYTHECT